MKCSVKWLVLAAMGSGVAQAQQPVGPYVGALLGSTEFREDGVTYSSGQFTWGALAGYQFSQNIGVEAEYLKPKTITESEGTNRVSIKTDALSASLVAILPLGSTWSLHARGGASRLHAKATVSTNVGSGSGSDSSTEFSYGGGFGLMLEGARIRFEYRRVDAGTKVELWSAGIVWFLPTGK